MDNDGAQGPAGPQGPAGADGADGADGGTLVIEEITDGANIGYRIVGRDPANYLPMEIML